MVSGKLEITERAFSNSRGLFEMICLGGGEEVEDDEVRLVLELSSSSSCVSMVTGVGVVVGRLTVVPPSRLSAISFHSANTSGE